MAGSQFPSPAAMASLGMSGAEGQVRYDLTGDEYDVQIGRFNNGYRIVDLAPYEVDGGLRFSVIAERDSSASWTADVQVFDYTIRDARTRLDAEGKRPTRFVGYAFGASRAFAWVWETMPGPRRSIHWDQPISELGPHQDKARNRGKRIVDLCGYLSKPDQSLFTSIWDEDDGTEWIIAGPVDGTQNQRDFDRYSSEGWRVARTNGWQALEGTRFVTLWEREPSSYVAGSGLDSTTLAADLATRDGQGQRPEQLGAYSARDGAATVGRFCPTWRRRDATVVVPPLVADFARAYSFPAVSLAVAKRGRLVYAHGHGEIFDETNAAVEMDHTVTVDAGGETITILEPGLHPTRPVLPDQTRFRIASVSKPITAAAVLRLVERGHLGLDDRIFAPGGPLAHLAPTPADPRFADITVRHLLQHGSGGWPGLSLMLQAKELSTDDLVRKVLAERALDNDPGTTYAYSNFGYCLLGRLIEAVTGRTYEQHVREDLLAACGITDMRSADDSKPTGDVIRCYPVPNDLDPYTMRIDRMDSHGGWLASAVDLLRFAVRVDGDTAVPDVIDATSLATMTTPSGLPGSNHYAAGWFNTDGSWEHTGALPGSTAVLQRTPDGSWWAVMTNTNVRDDPDPSRPTYAVLERLLTRIRSRVDFWPLDLPL